MRAPCIPRDSDPPLAFWTPPETTPAERDVGSVRALKNARISSHPPDSEAPTVIPVARRTAAWHSVAAQEEMTAGINVWRVSCRRVGSSKPSPDGLVPL